MDRAPESKPPTTDWNQFRDFDTSAYAYESAPTVPAAPEPAMEPAADAPLDAQKAGEPDEIAMRWALENPHELSEEASGEGERSEESDVHLSPDGEVEIAPSETLLKSLDDIPQKMAFKIGEAAQMIGVKQYVLRYWETEFDQLRPKKSKNNQRVYSRRDVETALMIKKLLYVDRFSIEGARAALRQLKREVKEERETKAASIAQEAAHDAAIKGIRHLVARLDRARARLSEHL